MTGQIEGVRQQTIAVLDDTIARSDEFELADPPPTLRRYHQKLGENTDKVLVVGEVKRVRSTFVSQTLTAKRPRRTYPNWTRVLSNRNWRRT